jgi:tetratricopeptide (TPR) repeat protein
MIKAAFTLKNVITLVCLFLSFICFSQTDRTLDSLQKEIITAKHDTLKINTYINIGSYFESTIPDSAIIYFEKAESIAKLYSGQYLYLNAIRASLNRSIGIIYYNQGNYNEALESFDKSFRILNILLNTAKTENNKNNIWERKRDISICFNDIGSVNRDQGNYDKALSNFLNSLNISEEMLAIAIQTRNNDRIKDQKKSMSKCFISIGTVHYFQNNFEKAINYYSKALKIFEDLIATETKNGNLTNSKRFKQGLSVCYNNIAMVNSDKANKNKSNSLLRDSLFKAAINDYKK